MEKSIEKFLNFLNEYKNELEGKIISLNGITNLIKPEIECSVIKKDFIDIDFKYNIENKNEKDRIIKLLGEIDYLILVIKEYGAIFGDFGTLSKFLLKSKLNAKECMNVISYFVSKNIDRINEIRGKGELEIVCFEKMYLLTDEEREFLGKYTEQPSLLNIIEFGDLASPDRIRANKLMKSVLYTNSNEIIKCLFDFKKMYIDANSKDMNDLNSIIDCLEKLNFDQDILVKIKIYLEKDLNKKNKKDEVKITPIKKTVKKSILMTDKEYRTIKKELRSYFDFYNVEKVRELNEEEIKKCIYLLLKIDTPIIEIQRFLRFFRLEYKDLVSKNVQLINDNNALVLYLDLFNKLKFYEKQLNISSNLKYIEECFMEMFICSSEDYEFYKIEIENELLKILNLLPQTFDYEIENIGKRIKLER